MDQSPRFDEEIVFAAKAGEWMAVKKFKIEPQTKPEEIALSLASIEATLLRKMYEYAGVNVDVVEAYVASLPKAARGVNGLAAALQGLKPAALKEALLPAVASKEMYPLAESYFWRKLLDACSLSPVLTPEMLADSYPHLKIPKPRGNFGKKKK